MTDLTNPLADAMADILHELTDKGFEFPLYFAVIGLNGAVLAGKCLNGETEVLASNSGPGFVYPVNIMFVDARGEAARIVLNAAGTTIVN